ncbi:hypothetical protein ES288_A12G145700v1 [Gossypium darwinii]|uniref:Uncharacterized protein n=1 Tax=Gossypium darwinii TaxID=34276 RepID=A0A5D2E9K4_GOSDA|nr:hypothetical protein ES288_A12G145700v1 [Gossypium darwinii]
MGNITFSCFVPNSKEMAKIIDARGNLKKVKLPVTAVEVMIEEPGHVISAMEELKRSRSVVAMRAEDELLVGKVYVLVPIGRVHCNVTDMDVAIMEAACNGKKRKKSGGAKISPYAAVVEEGYVQVRAPRGCRLGSYRRWTPVLESISEVI